MRSDELVLKQFRAYREAEGLLRRRLQRGPTFSEVVAHLRWSPADAAEFQRGFVNLPPSRDKTSEVAQHIDEALRQEGTVLARVLWDSVWRTAEAQGLSSGDVIFCAALLATNLRQSCPIADGGEAAFDAAVQVARDDEAASSGPCPALGEAGDYAFGTRTLQAVEELLGAFKEHALVESTPRTVGHYAAGRLLFRARAAATCTLSVASAAVETAWAYYNANRS